MMNAEGKMQDRKVDLADGTKLYARRIIRLVSCLPKSGRASAGQTGPAQWDIGRSKLTGSIKGSKQS